MVVKLYFEFVNVELVVEIVAVAVVVVDEVARK